MDRLELYKELYLILSRAMVHEANVLTIANLCDIIRDEMDIIYSLLTHKQVKEFDEWLKLREMSLEHGIIQ